MVFLPTETEETGNRRRYRGNIPVVDVTPCVAISH